MYAKRRLENPLRVDANEGAPLPAECRMRRGILYTPFLYVASFALPRTPSTCYSSWATGFESFHSLLDLSSNIEKVCTTVAHLDD